MVLKTLKFVTSIHLHTSQNRNILQNLNAALRAAARQRAARHEGGVDGGPVNCRNQAQCPRTWTKSGAWSGSGSPNASRIR